MAVIRLSDPSVDAPLYTGRTEPLVRSVLAGCMGEVYANDAHTAAVAAVGDLAFPAGDASCVDAAALLRRLLNGFRGETLLIVPHDDAWMRAAEAAWGNRAVRGERYALCGDAGGFDTAALKRYARTLPAGVRLRPIDGALYRRALEAEWSRDFVSLFRNEADYLARGLGVIALEGETPVAGASSYAVFPGGIEIQIDTRVDRRRRGLATACGAALMLRCFERGWHPNWDAANRESLALAQKLGYRFERAYPICMVQRDA